MQSSLTIFNSVLHQSSSIVLVIGVKGVTAELIHLQHNNIHDAHQSQMAEAVVLYRKQSQSQSLSPSSCWSSPTLPSNILIIL